MAQDAVVLCSQDGTELGRGLVNYSCEEVNKVKVRLGCCQMPCSPDGCWQALFSRLRRSIELAACVLPALPGPSGCACSSSEAACSMSIAEVLCI